MDLRNFVTYGTVSFGRKTVLQGGGLCVRSLSSFEALRFVVLGGNETVR